MTLPSFHLLHVTCLVFPEVFLRLHKLLHLHPPHTNTHTLVCKCVLVSQSRNSYLLFDFFPMLLIFCPWNPTYCSELIMFCFLKVQSMSDYI